jgi:hypothetical protein
MLGKLVLADELLSGVSGDTGEAIREALEHVIAVVRALVEAAEASTASGSAGPRAASA